MPSILYLSIPVYFIISGLSFFDYGSESFYAVQSQAETFMAFFIGIMCHICGREYRPILVALCAYSGYIMITDFLMEDVSIIQWSLEIILFSCLAAFLHLLQLHKNEFDA